MKKKLSLLVCGIIISGLASSVTFATDKQNDNIYKGVSSYVDKVYVNLNTTEKNELIEKLYKEKSYIDSSNTISNIQNNRSNDNDLNSIDESFAKVDEEENYIVNLINSLDKNTTLSNWEFNLNFLKENYNSIKDIENINLDYIDSYINV